MYLKGTVKRTRMRKQKDSSIVDTEISKHFREIIKLLGLDINDPNLKDTPERLTKMYRYELFSGLTEPFPDIKMFPLEKGTPQRSQMVLISDIVIQSTCAHHFLPVVGFAHVAYIPGGKNVIGLSKVHRIADHLARRPHLQEDLTFQIGDTLSGILGTVDIAVMLQCKHFCCHVRGVKDYESVTSTTYVNGAFLEVEPRMEFLNVINMTKK